MKYLLNQDEYDEYMALKGGDKKPTVQDVSYETVLINFIKHASIRMNRDPSGMGDNSFIEFSIPQRKTSPIIIEMIKARGGNTF